MPPIPFENVTKQDGNTGVVPQSQTGVLAIIANAQSGAANTPSSFTRMADALGVFGLGNLVEDAAYYLTNGKKPVLLIKPTCSTAAAFGAIDSTGKVGTSAVTFTGSALDEYDIVIKCQSGGTVGTGPITIVYSLDGGNIFSAPVALGIATTLVLNVPRPSTAGSSGITANFGVGTLVTGDVVLSYSTPAYMTNSDLLTALDALKKTKLPWDNVLIDMIATATTIGTVDSWLAGLEGIGQGKMAWMNTRHKNKPVPATEAESAYATAMATVVSGVSTIRVDVGVDGGYCASLVTGLLQFRPTSLAIATRANPQPVGIDPAWRQQGAVPGYQLSDVNGNPVWHDEYLFPGLDALQLSTLCSDPSSPGTFIGNARILSSPTSDFQFDQHARVANTALSVTFPLVRNLFGLGVRTLPPDQTTNKVYILPTDATAIEKPIDQALETQLEGQVQGVAFILSRTDDLSSNAGAIVTGDLQLNALRYIKGVNVTEKFVKSIAVPLAA